MYKPSKKLITVGIATMFLVSSVAVNAGQRYDSSNVGISSKVDEYLEEGNSASGLTEKTGVVTEANSVTYNPNTANITNALKAVKGGAVFDNKKDTNKVKYPQFENRAIVTVSGTLNIRAEASADSDIIGTVPTGGILYIEEKGAEWTLISSGDCYGYVKNEYIAFGDAAGDWASANGLSKVARINTTTLNVRTEANENADCITMVAEGEEYDLVNSSNGWTCILINGQNGYVKSDYVDIRFKVEYASSKQSESTEESTSSSEESSAEDSSYSESSYSESSSSSSSYDDDDDDDYSSSSSSESSSSQSTVSVTNDGISSTKQALVNYALQFVGNPYVYGGESLTNGTDCSGFTMLVYREFGISIPHGATSQSYYGTPISVDDVEPGDLLFYTDDEGGYGHVTMYIGNGQVVHASTPSTGIIISSMDYRTPAAARRLMD